MVVVFGVPGEGLLDGELSPRKPVGIKVRYSVLLSDGAEGDAELLDDAQVSDVLGVFDQSERRVHKIPCVTPALAVLLEEVGRLAVVLLDIGAAAVALRYIDVGPVVAGIPCRKAEPDLDAAGVFDQVILPLSELDADRRDRRRDLWGRPVLGRDEQGKGGRVHQLVGVGGVCGVVVGELQLYQRAYLSIQPAPDGLDAIDDGHGAAPPTWSRSGREPRLRSPCPRSSR